MFEKTKYKIGVWIARKNEKKNKRKAIDSNSFWNEIQTVVLGIPSGNDQLADAFEFAKKMQKKYPFVYKIWYTGNQKLHVQDHFKNCEILSPSDFTYRKWKIPEKKSVVDKFNKKPDLIIDLSMDFQLDGIYIWTCFPSAYRVGMFEFEENQFFDLIMKFKAETPYHERLEKLSEILNQMN